MIFNRDISLLLYRERLGRLVRYVNSQFRGGPTKSLFLHSPHVTMHKASNEMDYIDMRKLADEILAGFSVDPLDYQALFERERSEVRDQTHPAR